MIFDVAVIGGGIAGSAAAYYLASAGLDVCVLERDDIARHASGANSGSIHLQIPHEDFLAEGVQWASRFAPTLPLMARSIDIWAGLANALSADVGFKQTGGLLVAETQAQVADVERKAAIEREHGVPIEMLGRSALRRLAPYISDRMVGGAYCPLEGRANPLRATFAFAAAARRHGASFRVATEVIAIEVGDRAATVATADGRFRARRIVNAAGTDAARIAAMAGIDIAVEAVPLQASVTAPLPPLVQHLLYFAGGKLTLKQASQGALVIGGGWRSCHRPDEGVLAIDRKSVAANVALAARVVPGVAGAELVRSWPAIVNGTKDWRPILGPAPNAPEVYTLVFPWMGFTAGPAAGRATADLILGREVGFDIERFSVSRHQSASRSGAGKLTGETPGDAIGYRQRH